MEILCKKRTCLLAAFCFLLILMLIGSLFDAPISALLYHPETLSAHFLPVSGNTRPLGVVAAGSMLFPPPKRGFLSSPAFSYRRRMLPDCRRRMPASHASGKIHGHFPRWRSPLWD